MDTNFAYLISVLIALVSVGLMIYTRYHQATQWARHKKVLWILAVVGIIYSLTEIPALAEKIWQYNPHRILNIYFIHIPIETYFFTFTVFVLVGLATLALADKLDQRL